MIVAVTAETTAVTTDIVHSDTATESDCDAWPAERPPAPRGWGALALAATSTAAEATAGENVDNAGATAGLDVSSATAASGGTRPRGA